MKFTEFLAEVSTPDFEVSVDFGDGKFKQAGSFHSEQAAKREGREMCSSAGNGKRYKVTNAVTGKSQTYSATDDKVNESEANYVAMSAYKANMLKVEEQIEMLRLVLKKHQSRYLKSDRTDWGFAGDLEHLNQQLAEINNRLRK